MSISADKLRLLRRQAGTAPATGDVPAGRAAPAVDVLAAAEAAPPAPSTALPAAANDAVPPPPERSVFAWVEQQIRHKPTGHAAVGAADPSTRPAPATRATPALPAAPRPQDAAALRRLLGVRDRGTAPAPATRPRMDPADRHVPGQEIAPGLWASESFQPQALPDAPLPLAFTGKLPDQVTPSDLLFFDTETTGLAGGTGTRAFMIGAADWVVDAQRGSGVRVRQLLMTTMAAETAMLREFARWLGPSTVLCSYNGRCYDAPLLKTRYRLARLEDPISALAHVDLLFPTRRRYRGRWENCRLATIERQVLQIVREDDLPGSEAPAAWLHYLRGGSAINLRRVGDHNHQDVLTLAALLLRLVEEDALERSTLALQGPPADG